MTNSLSTQPYKGVRDFYPEDMAVLRYICDTWSTTAESFGFARYDASILEPAQLYKAKGAENEEMVNEQTYTFTDRGGREVTLRPEMTPTVARLVAARRSTLTPPIRWYSIPNLFRYERSQRGRLREHWQLNCDLFGIPHAAADAELIELAYQLLIDFGATPDMFEIRVNDRRTMQKAYELLGITDIDTIHAISRINDQKRKINETTYLTALEDIVGSKSLATEIKHMIESPESGEHMVVNTLRSLGLENVILDRSIARGFDYYTGIVFEIFDTAPENNRSMLGGGRYDDLTGLFGGEPISGVGFGMGDVTLRDFLETHKLLPSKITKTGAALIIIPLETKQHPAAQKLARQLRLTGLSVSVDYSNRKRDKRFQAARDAGAQHVLMFGSDEATSGHFTVQNLEQPEQSISGDRATISKTLQSSRR